ncbi:isocitrate lyase/phosphoenolpyruvate mutase family protein [Chitinophaga sp.]|uniref:isocitrate lyase/PEP mutase family protein n=1 Tax=Chitinophaga sp. TaxID=1869181 RepID=UPI0031E41F58
MASPYQQFKQLHHQDGLFLLPNAWNVTSALQYQEAQYPAVATTSAAVAGSLGYEDGEQIPFEEYLLIIRRIKSAVQVPVSVDLEKGYGDTPEAVYENLQKLVDLGIAGINIEDSQGKALQDADVFAKKITFLKNKLAAANQELFFNLRCDTYLLDVPNKQEETLRRLKLYENTGADSIFLPFAVNPDDIAAAVNNSTLPVTLMSTPTLPDFTTLERLGVKRVSMGAFLFRKLYSGIVPLAEAIKTANNFSPLF